MQERPANRPEERSWHRRWISRYYARQSYDTGTSYSIHRVTSATTFRAGALGRSSAQGKQLYINAANKDIRPMRAAKQPMPLLL